MERIVCAIDIGASGGKVFAAHAEGQQLTVQEVMRFPNGPVLFQDRLCWDLQRLEREMVRGIAQAFERYGALDGISVDTWGFDVVCWDKAGIPQMFPVCYRDNVNQKGVKWVEKRWDSTMLYHTSGIPSSKFTTLSQLAARDRSALARVLWMPDALMHFMGAQPYAERTIASTSQMLDVHTGTWNVELEQILFQNSSVLPAIVPSATITGTLRSDLQRGDRPTSLIATAGHDTAAAVAALPVQEDSFLYLICGTWCLLGTVSDRPITNARAQAFGLHNQYAADGKIRLQKGLTGLWVCQQLRKQWREQGLQLSYADEAQLLPLARDFISAVDLQDDCFTQPGDMAQKLRESCERNGMQPPHTPAEQLKCIYNSLAQEVLRGVMQLEQVQGRRYQKIYVAGGGANAREFMQLLADTTEKFVVTGFSDASALGNLMLQLSALGYFQEDSQLRQQVAKLSRMQIYSPRCRRIERDKTTV